MQCAQGVAYLHRMKPPMLHLDLKSGNFLVAFVSEEEEKRLRVWCACPCLPVSHVMA